MVVLQLTKEGAELYNAEVDQQLDMLTGLLVDTENAYMQVGLTATATSYRLMATGNMGLMATANTNRQ